MQSERLAEVRSGTFGSADAALRDYRAEWLGEVLVERAIWGNLPSPRKAAGLVVADTGYIWYRFWLPQYDQVVERYYAPTGALVGTQVGVCMPLRCDHEGCRTVDLLLRIWIDPDGRVTVHNEDGFEEAVRVGALDEDETRHAEYHLRRLTAAIAKGRFPPPLVRNWQIDPQRILSASEHPANGTGGQKDSGES